MACATGSSSLGKLGVALVVAGCATSPSPGGRRSEPSAPVATVTAPTPDESAPVVSVPNEADRASRDTLSGTIDEAIRMLRQRDYRTLIEELVHPQDLARFTEKEGGLAALVEEFADSDKPQQLLEMLESIRDTTPRLDERGAEATFETPRGKTIRFARIDGRWYLRNS